MRYVDLIESVETITLVQQTIPVEMLDAANSDPFLLDFVPRDKNNRLGIAVNSVLVGFMTPRQNQGVWRTGALYISQQYRNKGIASKAIQLFFSNKPNGKALVEPHNISSRKAFEKAGFHVSDRITIDKEEFDIMIK